MTTLTKIGLHTDELTPPISPSEPAVVITAKQPIQLVTDDGDAAENANLAVVVQESGEPLDAIETALQEAGVTDLEDAGEIAVIEIPPPLDGSGEGSMFVVLWGNTIHSLNWVAAMPCIDGLDATQAVVGDDALRPEVMAGVLATGNMAFGVTPGDCDSPQGTLMRWMALATPGRAAWDALDRFFLAKPKKA